jgi:hypothetical protein
MDICESFCIAINSEANKDYYHFENKDEDYKQKAFERLSHGDITSVNIIYDDEAKDSFYVKWTGESDYINESQDTYVSNNGDLFIVISEEYDVKTFFNSWDIDNGNGGVISMMWKFNKNEIVIS